MAEKLKVGIIGLGVGSRHIGCFDAHPDCEVTVLCDNNESKLRQAKEKFPGKNITRDAISVLSMAELDVVSIATYDDAHYAIFPLLFETDVKLSYFQCFSSFW